MRWVLLLAALAAMIPSLAGAQAGSTADKIAAIRSAMEEGQGLFVAGKYGEAARQFEQGFETYKYSAFVFNAGVAYTKMNDIDQALASFRKYVRIDPDAPDVDKVKDRIQKLEAAKAAAAAAPAPVGDAGAPDAADAAVPAAEAGAPAPAVDISDQADEMRSLVVIETEPSGAPLELFERVNDSAGPYRHGQANPGWQKVAAVRAPANVSLAVGDYHVVVGKYRDFNVSETDITVEPGKVLHFKANLSQGAFMAFLKVTANVQGAYVFLDDPKMERPAWGRTPHGELISTGDHSLVVDAPGFQPYRGTIDVKHGEQTEVEVKLKRVDHGIVRVDSDAPEIKVKIDDEPKGLWRVGEAPLDIEVPAGRHRLTVTSPGRKTYTGLIDVPRGQVLPVHAKMIPTYPRGPAWAQAIVGAALIGGGVYLGVQSDDIHSQLKKDREAGVLEQDDKRVDRGRFFAIGANAGYALGGALMVLATVNFIRDPLPESTTQTDDVTEFEDPRAAPPPAEADAEPEATPAAPRSQRPVRRGPRFSIGPSITREGGGLVVGGTF